MSSNHLEAYQDYIESDDDDSDVQIASTEDYLEIEKADGKLLLIPLDFIDQLMSLFGHKTMMSGNKRLH